MAEDIVLNELGEKLLIPWPPPEPQAEERHAIKGLHSCYNDQKPMKLVRVSKTHSVLCCENCMFRLPLPNEIDTLGKLRRWCTAQIKNKKQG